MAADRDLSFGFVGVIVGEGIAFFYSAEAGGHSCGEEQCLGQRCLPRTSVADERHVADVVSRVFLHSNVNSFQSLVCAGDSTARGRRPDGHGQCCQENVHPLKRGRVG